MGAGLHPESYGRPNPLRYAHLNLKLRLSEVAKSVTRPFPAETRSACRGRRAPTWPQAAILLADWLSLKAFSICIGVSQSGIL
jgi:hypothetical protein